MPNTHDTVAEQYCRAFASEWPTVQTRRGISLAEAGTITWEQLERVFHRAQRNVDAILNNSREEQS